MKVIQLTKGAHCIVDDTDFDRLNKFKWHLSSEGYARRSLTGGKSIYMHRIIIAGKEIDHKDGDRLNNQRENLRTATRFQNCGNRRSLSGSSSRFKGVTRKKDRWQSGIKKDRKFHYLGMFDTEEGAAQAYNDAATDLFGEFARLNPI